MRRTLLLLTLTACSGIPPHVDALEVQPEPCGAYKATLRGGGLYGQAELLVDGKAVRAWPISGALDEVHDGTLEHAMGKTVPFELRAGSTFIRRDVAFPEMTLQADALLTKTKDGTRLLSRMSTGCPTPGATWSAELLPGGSVGPFPYPSDGTLVADLPPIGKEAPSVRLTLHTADGGDHVLVVQGELKGEVRETTAELQAIDQKQAEDSRDADHDGWDAGSDCDDHNPKISPGVREDPEPNSVDDDCDGKVDEGTRVYDDDGDGYSEDRGDCDDDDNERHPGARETPDCRDQNCDGDADVGVTIPQVDDSQEPNGTMDQATDLGTGNQRSFSRTLRWVTSSASDEEWIRFHSDDGLFDDWGIDVELYRAPPGATWQVELYKERSKRNTEFFEQEGDMLLQRGAAMSSDSGDFWLRVKPVGVPRPWCPFEVRVTSR